MDVHQFKKLPIIGILRGIEPEMVEPIVDLTRSSGLQAIEVTLNTRNAPQLIRRMVQAAQGDITIGAGTVLTLDGLHSALDAGASFIVLPCLVHDVVEYCAEHEVPVFPGALTPHEIYTAWRSGATMVKVFPAGLFGPAYFREIKGPFQDLPLLACGGVTSETICSFFASGASGAAFGNSIFRAEWLKNREYQRIQESLKTLLKSFQDWKSAPPFLHRPNAKGPEGFGES